MSDTQPERTPQERLEDWAMALVNGATLVVHPDTDLLAPPMADVLAAIVKARGTPIDILHNKYLQRGYVCAIKRRGMTFFADLNEPTFG